MNRAELVEVVARLLEGSSALAADRAVAAVLRAVLRGLKRDGSVKIRGFGTFLVKRRRARAGRDPRNQSPVRIPASRSVSFRPAPELRAVL